MKILPHESTPRSERDCLGGTPLGTPLKAMRKSIRAAVGVKVKRLSLIRSELLDLHTGVLFFGAGLSIIDMIFDILMVHEFALQGKKPWGESRSL